MEKSLAPSANHNKKGLCYAEAFLEKKCDHKSLNIGSVSLFTDGKYFLNQRAYICHSPIFCHKSISIFHCLVKFIDSIIF